MFGSKKLTLPHPGSVIYCAAVHLALISGLASIALALLFLETGTVFSMAGLVLASLLTTVLIATQLYHACRNRRLVHPGYVFLSLLVSYHATVYNALPLFHENDRSVFCYSVLSSIFYLLAGVTYLTSVTNNEDPYSTKLPQGPELVSYQQDGSC